MLQAPLKTTPGVRSTQPRALALATSRAFTHAEGVPGVDCCAKTVLPETFAATAGRSKLRWLPAHLYCSILGTCFTTQFLRKLVARRIGSSVEKLSDLEVHEEAVQGAMMSDAVGRIFNKALDQQHQVAIKRFDKVKTPEEILALWEEAKRSGDIPGAYWATLTHRTSTQRIRDRAFGDVHMLSHLVGAANCADIRRLAALEKQNTEFSEKIERQQAQLRETVESREATIRQLSDQLAERLMARQDSPDTAETEPGAEVATLRNLVGSLQRRLGLETSRREKAEARAHGHQVALAEAQAVLRAVSGVQGELQAELHAAESHLEQTRSTDGNGADVIRTAVRGHTILYVGGRPRSTQAIRDLVVQADGEFLSHDGGIEQRSGLLLGDVHRADLIFFPVDCVSHDAALMVKRLCIQAAKRYRPLRSASIASFLAGLRSELGDSARLGGVE